MRKGRAADILPSLPHTQHPADEPSKINPPSDGACVSSPLRPAKLSGATRALLREWPGLARLCCAVLVPVPVPTLLRAVPLCRGRLSPSPAPLFPPHLPGQAPCNSVFRDTPRSAI